MGDRWISASDVEKFGYCPLSWWLSEKEKDVVTEGLKKGKKKHEELGETLAETKDKEEESSILQNIILGLAISATIVSISGLTFLYPEHLLNRIIGVNSLIWLLAATYFFYMSEKKVNEGDALTYERLILIFAMVATVLALLSLFLPLANDKLARLAQVISLGLLVGASYWLKRSLSLEREIKDTKNEMDIEGKELEYVDRVKEKSKMMKSMKYHLRGRPDYILNIDGDKVPVEVKSGRVPEGPFFSHVIQIAAYCFLIEEDMGETPPYGLVRYGSETEYEVEYDEELKELLLEKVGDMRDIIKKEEAHRNHSREGKCRNCSRREICSESLVD